MIYHDTRYLLPGQEKKVLFHNLKFFFNFDSSKYYKNVLINASKIIGCFKKHIPLLCYIKRWISSRSITVKLATFFKLKILNPIKSLNWDIQYWQITLRSANHNLFLRYQEFTYLGRIHVQGPPQYGFEEFKMVVIISLSINNQISNLELIKKYLVLKWNYYFLKLALYIWGGLIA